MGKQSRRQRKHLRGSRGRAELHGLPVAPAPLNRPSPAHPQARASSGQLDANDSSVGEGLFSKPSPKQHWWSSWPLSMKVVLAGIVMLIVFGLYRRCTEDSARAAASDGHVDADGAASVQAVVQPPADSHGR